MKNFDVKIISTYPFPGELMFECDSATGIQKVNLPVKGQKKILGVKHLCLSIPGIGEVYLTQNVSPMMDHIDFAKTRPPRHKGKKPDFFNRPEHWVCKTNGILIKTPRSNFFYAYSLGVAEITLYIESDGVIEVEGNVTGAHKDDAILGEIEHHDRMHSSHVEKRRKELDGSEDYYIDL